MNRSIHFSLGTIISIATIASYISLNTHTSLSQPTPQTCSKTKEGYPFPKTTGYIKGYQLKAKTGLSSVTIDNSQGDVDVFIKLFTLSSERPQTIRSFLVKQGERFTVENVTRGTYDIRYRNLSSCRLFRTKTFKLKEEKISTGTKFSKVTFTMYAVANGNTKHYPIGEDEF